MAGFLYYVPELRGDRGQAISNAAELLAALPAPVRSAFGLRPPASRGCTGPDGKAGVVLSMTREGLGYHADRQDWRDTGEGYWVGVVRDALPKPEELERPTMLSGYRLELGDGCEWLIPSAPYLARKLVRVEGGGYAPDGEVLDQFRDLHAVAEEVKELLAAEHDSKTSIDDWEADYTLLASLCVRALAPQYHVGAVEAVDILGLLTTDNVVPLLKLVIDLPKLGRLLVAAAEEMDPKKAEAAPGTPAGGEC